MYIYICPARQVLNDTINSVIGNLLSDLNTEEPWEKKAFRLPDIRYKILG